MFSKGRSEIKGKIIVKVIISQVKQVGGKQEIFRCLKPRPKK
jgi:hypothetical protein